jgi:hypothetical protein
MTRWNDPAGPLDRLATEFGLPAGAFVSAEGAHELSYLQMPINAAGPQLAEVVAEVHDKYGPAVTLRVKIGNRVLDLGEVREKLSRGVVLDLFIDKRALATYWGLTHPDADVRLMLYGDALERALAVSLTELDSKGLLKDAAGERKIIVAAPQKALALELDCDYLAILGGEDAVSRWQDHLPQRPVADTGYEAKALRDRAADSVRWVQFNLTHVTPLHLNLGWKTMPAPNDPIAGALYAQLLTCSILYTAGRAIWIAGDDTDRRPLCTAVFASEKYVATFDLRTPRALRQELVNATPAPFEAVREIGRRAVWAYQTDDRVSDRLSVLQSVVASSLQDYDAAANPGELVRKATEISTRIESGWTSFVKGRLEQYFSLVRDFEGTVVESAKKHNEEVQSLTKTLIDSMLAAVAVIVGSFVAAMFQRPFQRYVFWFGVGVYLAYLIAFPIIVGLLSTYQRFRKTKDAFAKRKTDFARRLSGTSVDTIIDISAVKAAESWFLQWFWSILVLYVIVLSAVAAAMWIVPAQIERRSDDFIASGASYGASTAGAVTLIVRGSGFDKDKEIVVSAGGATFTNAAPAENLKLHGSTLLTFSIPHRHLSLAQKNGFITVRQGHAPAQKIRLQRPRVPSAVGAIR